MNYLLSPVFDKSRIYQSMKNRCQLFCVTVLLLSTVSIAYANTNTHSDSNLKTLLTIKLYSEPHDHVQRLTYIVTLPKGEYYSYYIGGDLPKWRVVDDNVIQGEFRSVSLVTIRIHPGQDKSLQHKAGLTVIDPEKARVIWQGELNYTKSDHISVKADIDNQNYYNTTVKTDKAVDTVWLETTDK